MQKCGLFFCTYCNKSTRDIGDFICHIKIKHLDNASQYHENNEDVGEVNSSIDDGNNETNEQDYVDFGSYLAVNMQTDDAEDYENHHKKHNKYLSEKSHTSQNTISKTGEIKIANIQFKNISKTHEVVELLDDDEEELTNEQNSDKDEDDDLENKIETHTSHRTSQNNSTAQQEDEEEFDYTVEQYPVAVELKPEIKYEPYEQDEVESNNNDAAPKEEFEGDDYNNLYISNQAESSVNEAMDESAKKRQTKGPAFCVLCNRSFPFYSLYRNHMIKHSTDTPYGCTICKKRFKSKQAVRYHLTTHQRDKKQFKCDICKMSYFVEQQFLLHMMSHENEEANIFPCQVCGAILNSIKEREAHLAIHSKERPFRCPHCGKLFRLRHHLSNHLKLHQQYRCDFCVREFTSESAQRKPYACPQCQQSANVMEQKENIASSLSMQEDDDETAGTADEQPMEEVLSDDEEQNNTTTTDVEATVEMVSDDEDEDGENNSYLIPMKTSPHHSEAYTNRKSTDQQPGTRFSKRFKCKYCPRAYSHPSGLNYHIRDKHF